MSHGWREVSIEDIPSCFEGIIPSTICTVGADGRPNVSYLSVVQRVDGTHVALSRQFFKKTEENTTFNPRAMVGVVEPGTHRSFHLDVLYERTECDGPLFERMRAKLDAVAAHDGMANVFKLRGVDICRVLSCTMVPCDFPDGKPRPPVKIERVAALSQKVAAAGDLDELLAATLDGCEELLGYPHAFIMLIDETGKRLYTVASAGYSSSGAGSEVMLGDGIIGLAAERKLPIRVTQMTRDLAYSHAARDSAERSGGPTMERVIPLPALPAIQSQLVVPMLAFHGLVGVICVQSQIAGAFQAEDESVLAVLANQVAVAMAGLGLGSSPTVPHPVAAKEPATRPAQVKHYAEDDSVFIDTEYLIKGVAGGILWRLLQMHEDEGRAEFSNREIRLDQSLDLPDIKDNLEARLILLRKRLEERCDFLRIERTSRGRFRLVVRRPIQLVSAEGGGPL